MRLNLLLLSHQPYPGKLHSVWKYGETPLGLGEVVNASETIKVQDFATSSCMAKQEIQKKLGENMSCSTCYVFGCLFWKIAGTCSVSS